MDPQTAAASDGLLRIGDNITLYCDDGGGYIYAENPVDTTLLVWPTDQSRPNPPNIHGCAFKVVVVEKYKASKKCGKLMEELAEAGSGTLNSRPDYIALRKLARAEAEDNAAEQARQNLKPVRYGTMVQFIHVLTGKYLRMSSTDTAAMENTHMYVDLGTFPSKHTRFMVMPRFKVRAEGDCVRYLDKVMFESVKSAGTYLHCANRKFTKPHVFADCYEVNVSVQPSSLTIDLFNRRREASASLVQEEGETDRSHQILHGGDVVRLLHKETSGYVAAEGNQFMGALEDVHLRVRVPDVKKPHTMRPPTSSSVYWQVILDSSPASGAQVHWQSLCRLRHQTTKRYLALVPGPVGKPPKITMTDDHSSNNAVFRLHPVVKEGNEIEYGSYMRIEHPLTKTWLAASSKEYARTRYESMPKDDSLRSLQWDDAGLLQLTASNEMRYDDAFIVQVVFKEDMFESNFAAGSLPAIFSYLRNRKDGVRLEAQEAFAVSKLLRKLSQFNQVEGLPVKNRQKQLRHFLIIDMLVDCLLASVQGRRTEEELERDRSAKHIYRVCGAINDLLHEYLEGESRKNENYFGRFLPSFIDLAKLGRGLETTVTISELMEGNRAIVDRIQPADIDALLNVLKREKDPHILHIFSNLCVCDGVAIIEHQNYICKRILVDGAHDGYLFYTDPTGSTIEVRLSERATPMAMSDFCKFQDSKERNTTTGLTGDEMFDYLVGQLQLFGKLCVSRNTYCLEIIQNTGYLTWREVFIGLADSSIPNELRAVYCDVVLDVFIDTAGSYDVLSDIQLVYDWNKLSGHPYIEASENRGKSITGSRLDMFNELSQWIFSFLSQHTYQVAERESENQFLSSVLRVVKMLIAYGYFTATEDIKTLLVALMYLMQGTRDKQHDTQTEEERLEWLENDRRAETEQNKILADCKQLALECFDLLLNFRLNVRIEQFLYDFKVLLESKTTPSHLPGRTKFTLLGRRVVHHSGPNLTILNSLCQGPVSKENAMEYIDHLFARTNYVESVVKNAPEILLDLSSYHFAGLELLSVDVMDRLHTYCSALFDMVVRSQILLTDASIQVYQRVSHHVPHLRLLFKTKMNESQERAAMDMLLELARYCELYNDASEPHPLNQRLITNTGFVADLLEVLTLKVSLKDPKNQMMCEIVRLVLLLLGKLANKNPTVQQRLSSSLSLFLKHKGTERDVASCLVYVFEENRDIKLNIRDVDVRRIVALLAEHQHPEFLRLLRSLMKFEDIDVPLKRNQTLVVKYIMQYRDRVLLLINDEENEDRLRMLASPMSPELYYHLELVELLAVGAQDENRYIESMCQSIFSVEELFEVFLSPKIPILCKLPYVRFFVFVYLEAAASLAEVGLSDLVEDPRLWELMQEFLSFVVALVKKKKSKSGVISRLSTRAARSMSAAAVAVVLPDNHELTEGFDFIVDGICEFVVQLCKKVYKNADLHGDAPRTLLTDLACSLVDVWSNFRDLADSVEDLEKLQSAVMALSDRVPLPSDVRTEIEHNARSSRVNKKNLKPSVKEYLSTYGEEIDLNERVDRYAQNLCHSYEECRQWEPDQVHDTPEFKELESYFFATTQYGFNMQTKVKRLTNFLVANVSNMTVKERERVRFDALAIKVMQMLRYPLTKTDGDEREKLQNDLCYYNTPMVTIEYLSSPSDELVRECLLLLVALLEGGNKTVQNVFRDYFLNTREERFFMDIQSKIKRSAANLKEQKSLRVLLRRLFNERALANATIGQAQSRALGAEKSELELVRVTTITSMNMPEEIPMKEMTSDTENNADSLDNLMNNDGSHLDLILRVLQLMCENFNDTLKNYLRDQPDNFKRINLVQECANYLQLVYENINDLTFPIVKQLLSTLNEFASGNVENQLCMFDAQIVDMVNRIFRQETLYDGVSLQDCAELNSVAADLVFSLIEDESPAARRMALELDATLDLNSIFFNINRYYHESKLRVNLGYDRQDTLPLDVGFKFYRLINRLRDLLPEGTANVWRKEPQAKARKGKRGKKDTSLSLHDRLQMVTDAKKMPDAIAKFLAIRWNDAPSQMKFFKGVTATVEIVRNDELQKVYFRKLHEDSLNDRMKEWMKWNLDRSSPTDKIRDFVEKSEFLIVEMDHQRALGNNPFTHWIVRGQDLWRNMIIILTLVLNAIMLGTYSTGYPELYPNVADQPWATNAIYILGAFHLLFCTLAFVQVVLEVPPIFPKFDPGDTPLTSRSIVLKRFWHAFVTFPYFTRLLAYYFLLCGFSLCGIILYGYFFALHLLHMIVRNDLLQRVIQSVTKNGRSLLWVAALGVAIIYIFAVAAFVFFPDEFQPQNLFCSTLWECFISCLNIGLLDTLGGNLQPQNTSSFYDYGVHTVFDIAFWVIITTIGLNIIFGIIVDTFGELRDEKWSMEEDMRNSCTICSCRAYDLEREGSGFDHHIKHEHNMWNYLFFFMHLDAKDPTDYNANEAHVQSLREEGNVHEALPVNRALCLSAVDDQLLNDVQELKKMIKEMSDRFLQEDKERLLEDERSRQREWEEQVRRDSGVVIGRTRT